MNPLALCDFGPSQYLLFGPDVGPLQYYSHLPIIAIAIGLAGFIYPIIEKLSQIRFCSSQF